MHAVAAFFVSIIAVVTSVFASPTVAPNAPVDIRAAHTAAAVVTQVATTSNPFLDPSAPPVLVPPPSSPPPQTVINQPVIELNVNATSTIEIGDSYNDLGARIVAPASDLNLGLVIVLDGATTTAVSIDTTAPGEHTILYTVTSPTTGLTGSVMRIVIISPAEQAPSLEPANDNPFIGPPVNDNASSTAALDAAA